jgi:RNA polymerase sigma factor (sigma-70 family)
MTRSLNDDSVPATASSVHIRGAVAGDLRSVEWVANYYLQILTFAAGREIGNLRTPHDIDDIVQDTWARVLEGLPRFVPRGDRYAPAFMAYMMTILRNRVREIKRGHLRERRSWPEIEADRLDVHGAVAAGSTAHAAAVDSEVRGPLGQALASLDRLDAAIVIRRGIAGDPPRVIAVALGGGLSPNAISQRYARALKRLRAMVPRSLFDEFDSHDADEREDEDRHAEP